MDKNQIFQEYVRSADYYSQLAKHEEKILTMLSVFRLITFLGGLILTWIGFTQCVLCGMGVLLLVTAFFLFLLKSYSDHSYKKEFYENLSSVNKNELNAVSGDFSIFYSGAAYTDIKHDFSFDLDLFGNSSLYQFINRTVTGYGRDILAGWFSDPYGISGDLQLRQETVKELAFKMKWRHEFMALGMKTHLGKDETASLICWMENKTDNNFSPVKKFLLYLLPVASVLSLILTISGIISYMIFILIFLINLLYIASGLRTTNRIHNVLSQKFEFLYSMTNLLKSFEKEPFSSSVLNKIKVNIAGKSESAAVSIKRLGRLIQSFDSRNNQIVGLVLNGMFLWDYHCIRRLENWKSEYRGNFPVWLNMIGKVDAFISLANYSFNNPGFAFPSIRDGSDVFSAKELGHPLIDEKKRVCNDFTLGKKGSVCIISGANMAGKSTFLRTIAINYILGMIGAPVCAREMKYIPMKIFTSMRTIDSLTENESYFYAELKRLKILKMRIESSEPVLFILDEILKGTNSADKSSGSILFMRKIIEKGGTGLIATHDISLGNLENEYQGTVSNKCFEIDIEGESITFDYKIRDGITKKMNAVFLMSKMGILD